MYSQLFALSPSPCFTTALEFALPKAPPTAVNIRTFSSICECSTRLAVCVPRPFSRAEPSASTSYFVTRKSRELGFESNGVLTSRMELKNEGQYDLSTGDRGTRTTPVIARALNTAFGDLAINSRDTPRQWGKSEGNLETGRAHFTSSATFDDGRKTSNYTNRNASSPSQRAGGEGAPKDDDVYTKSFSGQRWESSRFNRPPSEKVSWQRGRSPKGNTEARDQRGRNSQIRETLPGTRDAERDRGKAFMHKNKTEHGWSAQKRSFPMNGDSGNTEGRRASDRRKEPTTREREQVQFSSPIIKEPHVAILGGGMSGLMCALTLEERGIRSTVFDTGKHGLGGRMGTRHIAQLQGSPLVFDHAAQFFTVASPDFRKHVNRWISDGVVEEWYGCVGRLEKGGHFMELPHIIKYIAKNGMRLLADHMVTQSHLINIKRPCWISRMDASNNQWHLTENGKPQGEFDAVVIAHNGKCANRLLAPAGVPLIAKQMKRLELSSIWALLAAFEETLPSPKYFKGQLHGAFVDGVDSLSWMANNTNKILHSQDHGSHCWTFFSTAAYGKKNKVPQESIPTAKAEKVKREMLQGVEIALGLAEGSLPHPVYTKVQLWGAALPKNTPNVPCIFDPHGRVGICGDWLLGSNLEAAALSGIAMGHHIANYCNRGCSDSEEYSIGLDKEFLVVDGHDIGQFSGTELMNRTVPQGVLTVA